jgi:hypothetical protein
MGGCGRFLILGGTSCRVVAHGVLDRSVELVLHGVARGSIKNRLSDGSIFESGSGRGNRHGSRLVVSRNRDILVGGNLVGAKRLRTRLNHGIEL